VEVNGPLDYYSGRINGQPEAIRENMLKHHASLTHYISGFTNLPTQAQADFLLKLAYGYLRQNGIHRKDSLGYAHFYANRSMETHETPQGHLLMAKLLLALANTIPPEKAQQSPPTAYLAGALKAAESALELNPNFLEAQIFAANQYAQLGQVEKAIAAYQKSIQMNPKFPDPHFALAVLLKTQGKFSEAKKYFESFLKIVPNSGVYQKWIQQAKQYLRSFNKS
jgi:tetratricopeptide (TPR) repeat protein